MTNTTRQPPTGPAGPVKADVVDLCARLHAARDRGDPQAAAFLVMFLPWAKDKLGGKG